MQRFRIRTPSQLQAALRTLRSVQELTQSELGRKVGLSQERISAIENHPERLTLDQLLTVLMALEVELVIEFRSAPTHSKADW